MKHNSAAQVDAKWLAESGHVSLTDLLCLCKVLYGVLISFNNGDREHGSGHCG